MQGVFCVLSVATIFAATTLAGRAMACGEGAKPWVVVQFGEGVWEPGFQKAVLDDLRAGLQARGVEACLDIAEPTNPPTASVTVSELDPSRVGVSVEVRDAVTQKRVSRDVDLGRVPRDGRAFAVALAADELVWATWAELALEPDEKQQQDAPPELVRAVERRIPKRRQRASRLGARAVFDHYTGGQTSLGADLVFLTDLTRRLQLELNLGLRQGLDANAPHGTITSRAVSAGSGLRLSLYDGTAFVFHAGLGLRSQLYQFVGQAAPAAEASEFSALTVESRGGLLLGFRAAESIGFELGAHLGWPLRGVEATDEGERITGARGLHLSADLGMLIEL